MSKVPFVEYADFECITEASSTRQPNISKLCTKKMARHVPLGFTYKILMILITSLKNPLPTENENPFKATHKCFNCMQDLGSDLVPDHCHCYWKVWKFRAQCLLS